MLPGQNMQHPDDANKAVNIGNASNPSSRPDDMEPLSDNQLLSEGAEKYLREVASPEDYPDAKDEEEMNRTIEEENNK